MPPPVDYKKPVFLNRAGLLQNLPDGSITNIGGTVNSSFFVDGQGVLFDDGSSTDPSNPTGITLQKVYERSSDVNGNASIKLITGKDLVFYDNDNANLYFRIDAETGKVTITGDLEVYGQSSIINTVIQDSDHWRVSPASSITTALKIEPEFNTPLVDVISVRHIVGGPLVFRVDKDGRTHVTDLFASGNVTITGNIVISGTVDGVDVSNLSTTVTNLEATLIALANNFTTHITPSASIKHTAVEISVVPPPYAPTASNVQQVLDAITDVIGSGGGGGGGGTSDAGLFVTDVTPTSTGIVGIKQYVPGTVPTNAVIIRATSDTNNVRIHFVAEGNSLFYNPTVNVDTIPGPAIVATLSEHPTDKRLFNGYADVVVTSSRVITLSSSVGVTASVEIIKGAAGPSFLSLIISNLPVGQTTVKVGDVVSVAGLVENSAVAAEIINGVGAAGGSSPFVLTLGALNSGGLGYKTATGTFTVSNLTGNQTVSARARNSLGTYGTTIQSNSITLDQNYPVIGPISVIYPVGQQAIKGSESATVNSTCSDFTGITYSPSSNLSIASPTTYNASKTATRVSGTYVETGTNYTITAVKASNGTVTSASTLVKIADAPPTAIITISGNPPRLQSSVTGNTYNITLTASQTLMSAPSVTASSGTLSAFTGSGKIWNATLTIFDSNPKGTQSFTITSMINQALVNGTTITSGQNYIIGGFTMRQITYPAFARYAPIGTNVTDVLKVNAKYAGAGGNLTFYPDTGDYFQGFTIVNGSGNYDPLGNQLFISDAAFAGSNTSGTLVLEVWEDA